MTDTYTFCTGSCIFFTRFWQQFYKFGTPTGSVSLSRSVISYNNNNDSDKYNNNDNDNDDDDDDDDRWQTRLQKTSQSEQCH